MQQKPLSLLQFQKYLIPRKPRKQMVGLRWPVGLSILAVLKPIFTVSATCIGINSAVPSFAYHRYRIS
jgi:hypothetical protein